MVVGMLTSGSVSHCTSQALHEAVEDPRQQDTFNAKVSAAE